MKFVVEYCLLLNVIAILTCQTLSEYSGDIAQKDKCPLTCWCKTWSWNNITGRKVKCNQNYWKRVPLLPNNTIYLDMLHMSIRTLRNGSFTETEGKTLRMLMLRYSKEGLNLESGAFRYSTGTFT